MRTYELNAILSLAYRAIAWDQPARDALAELAAEYPELESVADLLRLKRPAVAELPSVSWSFSSSDKTVQA